MADDAINLSIADVEIVAAEPRIHDLKLAKALGYKRAQDIRNLILRHIETLESFGPIFRKHGKIGRGRPGTDYYLTKKQALYITAKSDTERAAMVTIEMVEVFDRATTAEP